MSKKSKSKEPELLYLRAFRMEKELDEKLEKRAKELRVSCSWLLREYTRRGLLVDEEKANGAV